MTSLLYLLLFILFFVSVSETFSSNDEPNFRGNSNFLNKFPLGQWIESDNFLKKYKPARAWGGVWADSNPIWTQYWTNKWYTRGETNNKYPVFYKRYD